MRAIDADALIVDCQLAQKQADRHGKEFANAFYSGGGEISTEWWCVEDLIENAPTIEPERKMAKWNFVGDQMFECTECGTCYTQSQFEQMKVLITDPDFPRFCPMCGADMRGGK